MMKHKNLKKDKKHDFLYGRKYGKLTIYDSYIEGKSRMCECTCNCGNEIKVIYSKLIKGTVYKCKEC